jgi:hypothetical protein
VKLITLMAVGLLAVVRGGAQERQIWTARYALPPGGSVAVENVEGSIQVEGWDRSEVLATVVKTGLGQEAHPEDVRIAVESRPRSLTLRTLYPGQSEQPVRVDYRLRVPRQVRLEGLQTVEGDITVRGIEGSVEAHTLNGNIEQTEISGGIVARAINGNIAVALRALPDRSTPVSLETLNGHLYLALPPHANADLQLSTVAGRIESDYALSASAVPGDGSWTARLGQGGVLIRLRTVRGDVRVTESEPLL